MLKQTFATATLTGVDLSPYMLLMAEYKAQQAGLAIDWVYNLAETTTFAAGIFDLNYSLFSVSRNTTADCSIDPD
jgi:ubiquinone/menaquinone biosynthesis C-methylase UbiE